MHQQPQRIELFNVPLDCVNMEQCLDVVDNMVAGSSPKTIIAVNPEKIIKAQTDTYLLNFLRKSDLLIPDGIGAVVAARLLNGVEISRVPGADLMPAICQRAVLKGYKIFLLGANPDVNEKVVSVLSERFPGINIVGNQHGYFDQNQNNQIIDRINKSQADILFIALGSPAQELWMENNLSLLNVKVCQGVGGTFDVLTGNVKRAPGIFCNMHLEWFYRLVSQPKRLLRQTALPKFVFKVFKEKLFTSIR